MNYFTERKLQVIFDVHQYRMSQAEEQKLRDSLSGLEHQVANFPVSDLHILVEGNARTNDVSIKLTLVLPGKTLVANDHDAGLITAFERALSSLIDGLQAYKDFLGNVPERQKLGKGTHQEMHSSVLLDADALSEAAAAGDYAAFRSAAYPLEEPLRKRVGRWIQRYPDFEAQIGHGVEIDDIVEDVFLLAFERYESRPRDVPFGEWLDGLIDPAVKTLREHRDDELEVINLARTVRAVGEEEA